jgi:chemotaxis protein MotB
MKPSVRQCPATRRVRFTTEPSAPLWRLGVILACGLSLAASGCALSSQYREAIEQRQELVDRDQAQAARIGRLESDSVSIQSELADAYELVEDLRVENGELSNQVADLEEQESLLSEGLREQNAQLIRFQSDLARANQEVSQLTETYGELMSELESEVSAGRIQIDQLREGVRVAVSDEVLFDSGSARIDRQGEDVVRKISGQLASMDHRVEVQGHTDNLAISGSLAAAYPSNWELAAARAAAVVRLMEEEGVASDRITLTSFASNRPISENDSAEGRAMNRRIEIRLRPQGRATVSGDDLPVQSSPPGP